MTDGRVLLSGAGAAVLPVVAITAFLAASTEGKVSESERLTSSRYEMVEQQIAARGIKSPDVLAAMREVPRHSFVPLPMRTKAYEDHPLPIGFEQTISQPYIVALMTSLLEAQGGERVLEIGTGSGYHAAVMSKVVGEVFSIEIVEGLGQRARSLLNELGFDNIHVRIGDGYRGWPEEAPFDAIVLTAAPREIPAPLIEQLKIGGRMILPLGEVLQDLVVLTRTEDGLERQELIPVRFVPMTGEALEGAENPVPAISGLEARRPTER